MSDTIGDPPIVTCKTEYVSNRPRPHSLSHYAAHSEAYAKHTYMLVRTPVLPVIKWHLSHQESKTPMEAWPAESIRSSNKRRSTETRSLPDAGQQKLHVESIKLRNNKMYECHFVIEKIFRIHAGKVLIIGKWYVSFKIVLTEICSADDCRKFICLHLMFVAYSSVSQEIVPRFLRTRCI